MVIFQFTKVWDTAYAPFKPHPDFPGYELRIPHNLYIKKDQSLEVDLGLTVRIPPGYYGRVGAKLKHGQGMGVVALTVPGNCNCRLKVTLRAVTQNVNLKCGDVIAMLFIKKQVKDQLVERDSASMMVNVNPAPQLEYCTLSDEAWYPEVGPNGYYLKALEDYRIPPGHQKIISTGVAFRFPDGYHGVLKCTDAQTWLYNIQLQATYVAPHTKSEVRFILKNNDETHPYIIHRGDKVALLCLERSIDSILVKADPEEMGIPIEIKELSSSETRISTSESDEERPPPPLPKTPPQGPSPKHNRQAEEASGAEPEKGYESPLNKKHKPDCSRDQRPTYLNPAHTFNVTLIFREQLPEAPKVDAISLALERALREQTALYTECPCEREAQGGSVARFYASCVKMATEPVLTFLVSFAGDGVCQRDAARLERALEESVKLVCDREGLAAFFKVSHVKSEFPWFL